LQCGVEWVPQSYPKLDALGEDTNLLP
jgi:hypothetical protein